MPVSFATDYIELSQIRLVRFQILNRFPLKKKVNLLLLFTVKILSGVCTLMLAVSFCLDTTFVYYTPFLRLRRMQKALQQLFYFFFSFSFSFFLDGLAKVVWLFYLLFLLYVCVTSIGLTKIKCRDVMVMTNHEWLLAIKSHDPLDHVAL